MSIRLEWGYSLQYKDRSSPLLSSIIKKQKQKVGNVNWCSHYGKQYGGSQKNFKKKILRKLPYDPAIPLLGIYPKKMKTLIQKDTCVPMFLAATFTIAKIWKQPKCPSKKMNG